MHRASSVPDRRWPRFVGAARRGGDRGSAIIEFLGVGILLLVPIAYGMIALVSVESALLAAELAARNSARTLVADGYPEDGAALAEAQIRAAFLDQGHDPEAARVAITCLPDPDCRMPGAELRVTISYRVTPPFLPGGNRWLAVPLEASATFPRHR